VKDSKITSINKKELRHNSSSADETLKARRRSLKIIPAIPNNSTEYSLNWVFPGTTMKRFVLLVTAMARVLIMQETKFVCNREAEHGCNAVT
jgi:hypothetical protein